MQHRTQFTKKAQPFRILIVGEPDEINWYVDWFQQRGLNKEITLDKDYFEGCVILDPDSLDQYKMQLTVKNVSDFKKIEKSELKFDGIMFYLQNADLSRPLTLHPYKGWEDWGNGEIQRLLFIEAVVCPSEYQMMSKKAGDWCIIAAMQNFFLNIQLEKKPKSKKSQLTGEKYYI